MEKRKEEMEKKSKKKPKNKPDEKKDIVYLLGDRKPAGGDQELKYSLRSLCKYGTGYRKVFVVGRMPDLINTDMIVHIPHTDSGTKAKNVADKMLAAAGDGRVTKDFVVFSDDYFLLREWDFSKMSANHFRGSSLMDFIHKDDRRYTTVGIWGHNTLKWLQERGLDTLFYDMHLPFLVNKEKYKELMGMIDWDEGNYYIKTLYGNFVGKKGNEMSDVKIKKFVNFEKSLEVLSDMPSFSTCEVLDVNTFRIFNKLFPDKCKYEAN